MRQPYSTKLIFSIITACFLSYSPAHAQAPSPSASPEPCALEAPKSDLLAFSRCDTIVSKQITADDFENLLASQEDSNNDGRIKVCLARSADVGSGVVTITRDNLDILGQSRSRVAIKAMLKVNGAKSLRIGSLTLDTTRSGLVVAESSNISEIRNVTIEGDLLVSGANSTIDYLVDSTIQGRYVEIEGGIKLFENVIFKTGTRLLTLAPTSKIGKLSKITWKASGARIMLNGVVENLQCWGDDSKSGLTLSIFLESFDSSPAHIDTIKNVTLLRAGLELGAGASVGTIVDSRMETIKVDAGHIESLKNVVLGTTINSALEISAGGSIGIIRGLQASSYTDVVRVNDPQSYIGELSSFTIRQLRRRNPRTVITTPLPPHALHLHNSRGIGKISNGRIYAFPFFYGTQLFGPVTLGKYWLADPQGKSISAMGQPTVLNIENVAFLNS